MPILIITMIFTLAYSTFVYAGGQSTAHVVDQVVVDRDGNIGLLFDGGWDDPDSCNGGTTNGWIVIKAGSTAYSEQFAIAAGGFLQGRTVSAWLVDCVWYNNASRPVIQEMRVQ